jgi:HD-like signal output (HDOD) protein
MSALRDFLERMRTRKRRGIRLSRAAEPLRMPAGPRRPDGGANAGAENGPPAPPGAHERIADSVAELESRFSMHRRWADAGALLVRLARGGAVVRQPPLAARGALALLRRRAYGLGEVVELLEQDPALSQALLRHANSAWYAGLSSQPLVSLTAAAQRVGGSGVHAAVMQHIIHAQLSRPGPGLDPMVGMVWGHLVRTAPLARGLAPLFRADPEEAFLAGLLHDVGKLVFFDGVAEERKRLRRDLELPPGLVKAALLLLHEPLGGLAVAEWGMDARLARIISTHHRGFVAPGDEPLSEVVYAAEAVDVARQRNGRVDLAGIWEAGRLSAPREEASEWLDRHLEALEESARRAKRKRALGA